MEKIKQFGTMQMLVESLLDGFTTNEELLKSGDVGIGTGEGIDGELIIWKGAGYKVNVNGTVSLLDKNFPIVYADVHQSKFKFMKHYENISLSDIRQDILNSVNTRNLFFSVLIEGKFSFVNTRSAAKSNKPYPGLSEVAEGQANFHNENVAGHMIGYYTPVLYQGVGVPNFHQHFISNEFNFGGHVTDALIEKVDVSIQMFNGIDITIPLENQDYLRANLNDLDELSKVIQKAE